MVARVVNTLTDLWADGSFLVGRILENQFANEGAENQVVSDKIITEEEDGAPARSDTDNQS